MSVECTNIVQAQAVTKEQVLQVIHDYKTLTTLEIADILKVELEPVKDILVQLKNVEIGAVLETCSNCHRFKTRTHATFQYGKRSSYQRNVVVCVDNVDEVKTIYEKQLSEPECLTKATSVAQKP